MRPALGLLIVSLPLLADNTLPPGVRFIEGAVNSVTVGGSTAIYAAPSTSKSIAQVLVTHARREAVGLVPAGARLLVPATERQLFENPQSFWDLFETARFHDYAQTSTKVPVRRIAAVQSLADNERISVDGATIQAIATPGYTRGSFSYLIESGGKRIVCTGDLLYGDGKILDLYSLQDAVPEAKARGYHGYAARAEALIASLRKVANLQPDVLLPAHGPMISDPQGSISHLIDRLQTFLQSHFETDALRWYWGDDNHRIRSRAVGRSMNVLPMAEQAKLPPDILAIGNSRLIVSKSGAAFLVDAGYNKTLPELQRLRKESRIRSVDGIWITHYHDDHTEYINDVVKEFGSPVYFTKAMAQVMENPAAFRLPCLTTRPVSPQNSRGDGETLRWNEWHFTFWNFPGQTLYHGGLLAKRDDGQAYLFVGDSFTPSGMDDYCMQNRDFLRKGEGYDFCLRRIAGLPPGTWLMNQHVEPMFRYTSAQVQRMLEELEKRSAVLSQMSPWPDINYMVDESWARIYPYGSEVKPNQPVTLTLRITNHASSSVTYRVNWNLPEGWTKLNSARSVTIGPRKEGQISGTFRPAAAGLHVVTADVAFESWKLREWTEALVRVE